MSYLELNLDPFISLWRKLDISVINPLNFLSYVDSSFTGGISFTYRADIPLFSEISTLRKLTNSRINIRINPDPEQFKKVADLSPNVVTIINEDNDNDIVELPSKTIGKIINSDNKGKIPIIPRIKPEIKQLKQAYKLKCAEVELDTNQLSKADHEEDYSKRMEVLLNCYKIANKNNLRISFGGNLNKRLILALNRVMSPEFFSVGNYLLAHSLIKGIDNVLEDTVDIIE
ncbi:MAG TPA: pyridoxine 5'-phosphate synthase [bacterium]|nr:pyridoxine 5'-phosphate synthase [bacterium]